MTLYVVHIPHATPPHVITADADQVDAWLAEGIAAAVYEIAAVQTHPSTEEPA